MINWGIIGFGRMGSQYFNAFEKKSSSFNLVGIASKSKKNFKNTKGQIVFFENYYDLIKSDAINAIYISTLNNSHKELVIEASKYNKKILCEKPLGLTFDEVKDMHFYLKGKKNFFFEAIAYRSHPQTKALLEILKDKEIGQIKKIESNFGFKVRKIKKDSRLFNKNFGGGSILDLGCYPISFFNLLSDREEKMKIIKSNFTLCETDVDVDGEIILDLGKNIEAVGKVSLKENLQNYCKIYCDNAIVTLQSPWLPTEKNFIEIKMKSRYYKKIITSNEGVYRHQLEAVSDCFNNKNLNNNYLVDIEESLEIAKIIDLWRKKNH